MIKRLFAAFLGLIMAFGNVAALPAQAAIITGLDSPTEVVMSDPTSDSLTVTWNDVTHDETGFIVQLSTDGVNFPISVNVESKNPQGLAIQSYKVTGLDPNTYYKAQVVAHDETGNFSDSAPSDLSSPVATLALPPVYPDTGAKTATSIPLTLKADGNPAATTYSIQYTDNTNKTGGYVDAQGVAVKDGAEVKMEMATWNATGLVKGLTPNHSYSFKIYSYNGDGVNDIDGSVVFGIYQTLADTPQISSVFSASSSLVLSWKSGVNGGNEIGYEVGISSDNGNTFSNVQFNAAGPGSPDACMGEGGVVPGCMFTTLTGLNPATQYVVRVGATNDNGDLSAYAVRTATTSFDIDALTPVAYNITDKTVRVNIPNGVHPASIKYYLGLQQANGFDKGGNPILLQGLYTINPDGTVTFPPNTPVTDLTAKTAADWNATVISGFEKLGLATKDYVFQLYTPLLGNPNEKGGWTDNATSKLFTLADAPVISVGGGGSGGNGGGGGGGGGGAVFVPAPNNPTIAVKPGTVNTNTNSVTLELSAGQNPAYMAISANPVFTGVNLIPYATTSVWNFGNASGPVTVYALFNNAGGNSTVVSTTFNVVRVGGIVQQVLGEKISGIDDLIAITKFGERSENVRTLQTLLQQAGYLPKNFKPTNFYGTLTRAAVQKYQADSLTLDQLIAQTKFGEVSYKVYRLQTELGKLGYMPKNWKASYLYGTITKAAVTKYLASK